METNPERVSTLSTIDVKCRVEPRRGSWPSFDFPGVRRIHGDPRLCCETPAGVEVLRHSLRRDDAISSPRILMYKAKSTASGWCGKGCKQFAIYASPSIEPFGF